MYSSTVIAKVIDGFTRKTAGVLSHTSTDEV